MGNVDWVLLSFGEVSLFSLEAFVDTGCTLYICLFCHWGNWVVGTVLWVLRKVGSRRRAFP